MYAEEKCFIRNLVVKLEFFFFFLPAREINDVTQMEKIPHCIFFFFFYTLVFLQLFQLVLSTFGFATDISSGILFPKVTFKIQCK